MVYKLLFKDYKEPWGLVKLIASLYGRNKWL